jgi:hypothetical protein
LEHRHLHSRITFHPTPALIVNSCHKRVFSFLKRKKEKIAVIRQFSLSVILLWNSF